MSFFTVAMLAAAVSYSTPQSAVAAYGDAIARNDPALLATAFQPSAIMYCSDGSDLHATYQAQWKQRMQTSSPPLGPVSTTLEWVDASATTALARAVAVRGDKHFMDYLLLARLKDGWRIVGKLCQANALPSPRSAAAVSAVVDTKLAADRSWDSALLAESIDPRALVMTVENGEFVAATLAEWQARYVDRRKASPGNAITVTSRVIDARGDIGVARWSFRAPDGSEWTDRALMIRVGQGWRMTALVFAKEASGR
ncbi:nuclear transport factor 2 family protein [Sphingomonas sp. So64.6b]|uniref:nuclear transport factor 2 family protein n=1 Tax=Sphingomonas sp. So64.6b TaxID=2997354 RepID=UPI001601B813|nr:nuclear transport factor 2 family protein [Sphingomonas sp. So64.6b]QNA83095.1 nuclear transport factor 2 family protein [Sphingomonas sp. So64.6b]